VANKRDLKKHAEEFGEQGGASPKTQRAIRAAFKNQPKKAKKAKKETPKKKAWYEGIGKGRYAKKAYSAVKKGIAKEKARQKQYEIKSKKEQYESGQKSKDPRTRLATQAGYKAHKSKDKYGVTGGKIGPAEKPAGYKEKPKTIKFGAAFKANCAGKGASHTFSWNGKSYSCARASDKKTKSTKKRKRTYSFTKEQQDKAAKVVKARHEAYGWRTRKEEKEGTKKKGWRAKWLEERRNK
jgi:hypothetical protein|tara:strand:- start:111 stop:827 length:717 start_codon:yes stop_codon:yes gene_type:complete